MDNKTSNTERQINRPSSEELKAELKRARYADRYSKTLRSTLYSLIIVAAIAVLVATIFLPVLQIYGTSMSPTLKDGEVVVSIKRPDLEQGDVVAFYYNNKILVKRVIATQGEWVDIEEDGSVYVNAKSLDEPYLHDKSFGDCDIDLPYQVPDGKVFVMGDYREISIDSRNKSIGCISEDQIVGRLVFRIWPLRSIGSI